MLVSSPPDPARGMPADNSICLVTHNAYGAMVGGAAGHIGGVERQTTLMARWLAARGHRVDIVTWDEGQRDGSEIDGVRVLKLCRRDAGLPGLRFFHPRWSSLNSALRRADARVYYQNCGEYVTGQVALWARRHQRRFVYSVALDADCDPQLPAMRTRRERLLYRYGLRHAHRIIVQTETQRSLLRSGFGLDSIVLPMPSPGPAEDRIPPSPPRPKLVLWVGRITEQKRPDLLLDLATLCPDVHFDLVGPSDGGSYAAAVLERAKAVANVTLHGKVAREAVSLFYQRAACLCSTSSFEGFPNTFLEAWAEGLPVVATVDPDDLIRKRSLGRVALTMPAAAAAIHELLASPALWREASSNARRYYLENHAVEVAMPRFERVFLEVAGVERGSVR